MDTLSTETATGSPKTNGATITPAISVSAPVLMTLNGLTYNVAAQMVKDFSNSPATSDPTTNVWFSKDFVDLVYSILKYEGGNGVRIYFAKKEGKNSIVIVSTQRVPSIQKPGTMMNQDYFTHSTPLITSGFMENTEDYKDDTPGASLYSSADCPKECPNTSDSFVSCVDAKAWVKNFKDNTAMEMTKKSVWYGLKLIARLKFRLDTATQKTADGIRIYFMRNGEQNDNGFVILTTAAGENGVHEDYYDQDCTEPSIPKWLSGGDDHGEECPINCEGATL